MVVISLSLSIGYKPAGVGQGLGGQKGGTQQSIIPDQDHSVSSDAEPTLILPGGAGDNPDHHNGFVLGSNR